MRIIQIPFAGLLKGDSLTCNRCTRPTAEAQHPVSLPLLIGERYCFCFHYNCHWLLSPDPNYLPFLPGPSRWNPLPIPRTLTISGDAGPHPFTSPSPVTGKRDGLTPVPRDASDSFAKGVSRKKAKLRFFSNAKFKTKSQQAIPVYLNDTIYVYA